MDIKKYLGDKRVLVENALNRFMLQSEGLLAGHIDAMRYSLFVGGKRVRPILCLAAREAMPGNSKPSEAALATACALECIHTYSLIHDDLPAMDNDELRRGKPTNHVVFGEAAAILAGDGLLTFAFELLSRPMSGVAPQDQLRIINIISGAAGPRGMVGGQALDVDSEGKEIPFETLRTIHSCKTGALITCSVQAGAILGNADAAQFDALTLYGKKIGLAFQIVDDLLNVEGTPEQLGKAAGSDAERLKATYPAFFGVEATREKARKVIEAASASSTSFGSRGEPLQELAAYILNRKK